MLRLLASYRRAMAAADAANADTLPLDLAFTLGDGAADVQMTLRVADAPDAEPFAARDLSAADLDRLIRDLAVLRERMRLQVARDTK
jgi:hypothetical protein